MLWMLAFALNGPPASGRFGEFRVANLFMVLTWLLRQRTSQESGRALAGYGPGALQSNTNRAEDALVENASDATFGAAGSARSLLHLHQHGNGQHLHLEDAPVRHRRSELSHHPACSLTIPALLLLHPRSGDRSPGHVPGHVPSVSDHLLSEWPQLHRDRTPPPGSGFS
jgi:hypothetical protein